MTNSSPVLEAGLDSTDHLSRYLQIFQDIQDFSWFSTIFFICFLF